MTIKTKKSLGQNFLRSKEIINIIIETSDIKDKDVVLEIGPGEGVLTEKILEKSDEVIVVEKDDRLIDFLNDKCIDEVKTKKLKIIHQDILEFDIEEFLNVNYKNKKDFKYKIVANIPYYITGQIIRKFLSADKKPSKMVLMVQKEIAKRIIDQKESLLSLSVKVYGYPKYIKTVKAKYFSPQPKVDSAVLLINDISKGFFNKKIYPAPLVNVVGRLLFFVFAERKHLVNHGQSHRRCQKGAAQRQHHRVGQYFKIGPGHPAHQREGDENDQRAQRRPNQHGHQQFHRLVDGFRHPCLGALLADAVDLLHHHDGVVNHQADGGGDGAQRHDVQRVAHGVERNHRQPQGERDDEQDGEAGLERPEEKDGDEDGQPQPQQQGVLHTFDAAVLQIPTVGKWVSVPRFGAAGASIPGAWPRCSGRAP